MSDRPTEEQIREALEWLEFEMDSAIAWEDWDTLYRSDTILHLARRGAQRMAADRGTTHGPGCWRMHHSCAVDLLTEAAVLLREAEVSWGTERGLYPPTLDAICALLARIDQTEVDDG